MSMKNIRKKMIQTRKRLQQHLQRALINSQELGDEKFKLSHRCSNSWKTGPGKWSHPSVFKISAESDRASWIKRRWTSSQLEWPSEEGLPAAGPVKVMTVSAWTNVDRGLWRPVPKEKKLSLPRKRNAFQGLGSRKEKASLTSLQ